MPSCRRTEPCTDWPPGSAGVAGVAAPVGAAARSTSCAAREWPLRLWLASDRRWLGAACRPAPTSSGAGWAGCCRSPVNGAIRPDPAGLSAPASARLAAAWAVGTDGVVLAGWAAGASAPSVGASASAPSIMAACTPLCVRRGISLRNRLSTKATTATAAPARNTVSIESANPTRNGLASRLSICWRNEESCSTPPASEPPPPDWSMSSTGLFTGSRSTAGSRSAAWNSGVGTTLWNASLIRSPTVLNRMDRNTATPSVPPICRKNVVDAVATPMSRNGTAFCAATVRVCMQLPRPRPNTTMHSMVCHSGVSTVTLWNSSRPHTISAVPMIGKIL